MISVELPMVKKQSRERRSTYIVNNLREMIFDGELKPGDRLPTEESLCSHFGVSRTTLRESMQMLRSSGLVEVTPGRGSFVSLPDINSMMNDITLFGCYGNANKREVNTIIYTLIREFLPSICSATTSKRKELQCWLLAPTYSNDKNEEQERLWLLEMVAIANKKVTSIMVESLLNMLKTKRAERFSDHDELLRVLNYQLKLNALIFEKDVETASKVLASYLGISISSERVCQ